MRSPRGTSRRFSSRTERSNSLLSSTLLENRFPVLRPARHGEQQLITVSSDKIGHSSLMSKSVTQSTRLAFANYKSFLKSALCGGFIAAPSREFKLRIWHRFNNSTLQVGYHMLTVWCKNFLLDCPSRLFTYELYQIAERYVKYILSALYFCRNFLRQGCKGCCIAAFNRRFHRSRIFADFTAFKRFYGLAHFFAGGGCPCSVINYRKRLI